MAVTVNEFWGENYYNHPPLTDEMVTFAEKLLGVTMPKKYIELLRIQNGGYTKGFGYPMQVPPKDKFDYWELGSMAGIIINPPSFTLNILDIPEMTDEWGLPQQQVRLCGDGHTWISLDYRNGPVPTVSHIDAECGGELEIASSFDVFFDGLVPYSSENGVLAS